MGLYDLSDRLNWVQACRLMGISKSTLYRLVEAGRILSYGAGTRNRFFLRSELKEYMSKMVGGRASGTS